MATTTEPYAITIAEAADRLGVSKSYAYQLAKDGTLPVVRLGRRVLVPVESQGVVAVAALGERVEVVGRVTGGPQEGRHG